MPETKQKVIYDVMVDGPVERMVIRMEIPADAANERAFRQRILLEGAYDSRTGFWYPPHRILRMQRLEVVP
jgi:hypothetical protein